MEQITREEMIRALSFFRSAIQSGEEWSPDCDALYEHITTALQAAEPVVYQRRMRPTWDSRHPWTNWEDCSKGTYDDCLRTPFLHDWEHQVRALFTLPCPTAKAHVSEYGDAYQGAREDLAIWKRRALEAEASVRHKEQVPGFRSSKDGVHWPRIGDKYLVKLNGVLQEEIFEFDQGDDGAFSGGEYFWSRDDLDECPAFNADADEWLPLSALLTSATAKVQGTLQRFENETPVLPVVNAQFEVVDGDITGTTEVPVKRVEVEDDGSLTVVIDHWPEWSGPSKVQVPDSVKNALSDLDKSYYRRWRLYFEAGDRNPSYVGGNINTALITEIVEWVRSLASPAKSFAGQAPCGPATPCPPAKAEPVAWQYYQFGKWWNGDNLTRGQQKSIKEAGHPIRELYAAPQPSPDASALVEALELARDYVVEHLTKRREEFKGYEKLGGIAEIEADLAMIEEALAAHHHQQEEA